MMTMNIQNIIEKYHLQPHIEGGFYAETFRSKVNIPGDATVCNSEDRNLYTSIYYMISGEDISRFHVLRSDEMWFYHGGATMFIHCIDSQGKYTKHNLGLNTNDQPQLIIEAGIMFAAECSDKTSYSLVSCVVIPGFDFKDFRMIPKKELLELNPDIPIIIEKFGV